MEITQEERLDLTDKQVKEEIQAYDSNRFSNWCQLFGFDSKKVMEEYYHDIVINSEQYKKLEEQNKSLQAELDKQIKDNRKLVKALKEYANKNNWCFTEDDYQLVFVNGNNDNGFEIAQDVLKEIEEE